MKPSAYEKELGRRQAAQDALARLSALQRQHQADIAQARSNRREVRNPVLALPAAQKLLALPPEQRAVIAELLADLTLDARARAQESWRKNKGPMAAYWKAVGAYAHHFRRVLRAAK